MKTLILAGTATLALMGYATAQTAAPSAQTNAPTTQDTQSIRQHVQTDLQNAGFTDVKIIPESYLIRAKDKAGDPVIMVINPDSFSEVTYQSSMNQNSPNQTSRSSSSTSQAANGDQAFVSIPQNEKLSSELVGLEVYNNDNQDVGKIKDIAVDHDGIRAYILGVGGFLGMGDRYVAVSPDAVKVSYNDKDKTWHATINATADQLKSAPEFKYNNNKG